MATLTKLITMYRNLNSAQIAIWFIALTVIGFFLTQTQIADNSGKPIKSWEPWLWEYSAIYCYGLLCPIIIFCCYQWPLDNQQRVSSFLKIIALYIPFTLVFISLMIITRNGFYLLITGDVWQQDGLFNRYIYELPKSFPFYFTIVFGTYTKIYFETYQQEKIHAAKLNEELLKVQIDVLRNQLQPHFLFNTLNLISSTMYQDVDKADSIIARLGDLLRYALATEKKPWVKLAEEMAVMESFLMIAQLRFGEKMATQITIAPEANNLMIPAMLLQPLLENAVKYGIEPSDNNEKISLDATLKNNMLEITIGNPIHAKVDEKTSFGIGLKNTKERLALLYGDKASFSITTLNADSVIVKITLPQLRQSEIADNLA